MRPRYTTFFLAVLALPDGTVKVASKVKLVLTEGYCSVVPFHSGQILIIRPAPQCFIGCTRGGHSSTYLDRAATARVTACM